MNKNLPKPESYEHMIKKLKLEQWEYKND